jgi:hypothetical protein
MDTPLREWVDRAAELIPGYSGYRLREGRRESDKLYRESLAERLRGAKSALTGAMRELTEGGGLELVGSIDRVGRKLDQSENQIRYATYGYAGFFDAVTVGEAELEELYRFDLSLAERVGGIESVARELRHSAGDREKCAALVRDAEAALDELAEAWARRADAIRRPSPRV